jgi:hypothetical protein
MRTIIFSLVAGTVLLAVYAVAQTARQMPMPDLGGAIG